MSCCGAVGGALSTDWRLAARCRESRNGFFGGAGRVFVSWELAYAADASEFSDARDWESCRKLKILYYISHIDTI